MAQPMCGFCKNTTFAADRREVSNLTRPIMLVWCNKCGAVLGVLEYESAAKKLAQIAKRS